MGRLARRDEPGDIHHLYNRGLRRSDIAFTDDDRVWLVDEVVRAAAGQGAEVLAYCVMGNHHHWMMHCPHGGVSQVMKHSMSSYVRVFNETYGFDGPMFRARFGSKLVDTPYYLRRLSRYIHRNPLDIGWKDALTAYPFSSLAGYADSGEAPFWLRPNLVLDHFENRIDYLRFVGEDRPDLSVPSLAPDTDGAAIADALSRCTVESIEQLVTNRVRVTTAGNTHRTEPGTARMISMLLSIEFGDLTKDQLAWRYGYANGASLRKVAGRLRDEIACDPNLTHLFEMVRFELVHQY
jgi:REP element-mobilizing transposase RayT